MSRKSNTDARRAEIIAAMLTVLARHGYEKATIQAIAAEAGLAPGLIHYHFKTKQEILISLVQLITEYVSARFAQIAGTGGGPHARLESYLNARLGLGEGAAPDMVAAWVMIGAEAVRQQEVREVYQQAIAAELSGLGDILRECFAEQKRDDSGAPHLAAALVAMMEGAFQLSSAAGAVMPTGYASGAALAYARLSIAAATPA